MKNNYIEEVILIIFTMGFIAYLDERHMNIIEATEILELIPLALIVLTLCIFIKKHKESLSRLLLKIQRRIKE